MKYTSIEKIGGHDFTFCIDSIIRFPTDVYFLKNTLPAIFYIDHSEILWRKIKTWILDLDNNDFKGT